MLTQSEGMRTAQQLAGVASGEVDYDTGSEESFYSLVWRKLRQHRPAMISAAVLVLLGLACLFGPVLLPAVSVDLTNIFGTPTLAHPMGTDDLGRDIFTRILLGGRISLSIGLLSTAVAILLAGSLGCISGYFGGWLDNVLMRFVDAVLTIPGIFLIILLVTGFGATPPIVVLAIALTSWPGTARIIRGVVLSIKEKEFVEGARAVASGNVRIILRHILPNTLGPIMVSASLTVAGAILTESAISYLGYGIGPPIPSWGRMLFDAQEFIFQSWWYALFPGMLILMTVLCVNYFGDGLRDAFDPRSFER